MTSLPLLKDSILPLPYIPRVSRHLHAMLMNRGYDCTTDPSYRFHGLRRGTRECVVYQATLSGCGRLDFKGKTHIIPPGQALLVHIPDDHEYYFSPKDRQWEFIYVSVYGREPVRLLKGLIKSHGPILNLAANSPTSAVVERILKIDIKDAWKASEMAYALTMTLCQEFGGHDRGTVTDRRVIRQAAEFATRNLAAAVTVNDLAASAGFSRSHFSRLFTKLEGISPATFLRNARLEHAVRLLQTERLNIQEIALQCGFEDASYFCRVFKQKYGKSPKSYRENSK